VSTKRKFTTVGGTIACALGIGYFMQQGDHRTGQPDALSPLPVQAAVLSPQSPADQKSLEIQEITLTSAQPDKRKKSNELHMASVIPLTAPSLATAPEVVEPEATQVSCSVTATATVQEMASVDLMVSAPCYKNERLTVHHNGMMFTETTDIDGNLDINIPALAEKAVFIIEMPNGKGAVALVDVPSLKDYHRVALQWAGDNGFQVHALEFGAAYGESGHVWSGAEAAKPNGAEIGPRGNVTRLGDAETLAPKLAEIYTFPTVRATKTGTVQLSIETEVTELNCGHDIAAQSLELRGDRVLRTRDLVLSMPDCSAIGDFLVLNNLVEDLKIASK